MMQNKDIKFSVLTGLTAGLILWRVGMFLGVEPIFGMPLVGLVVVVPIVWLVGVAFSYRLGRWFDFFNQFGKFVALGFTNFAVDLGVLNLLIGYTGFDSGWHYSVFKVCSFVVAMIHSFVYNKYWVFNAQNSGDGKAEFTKFAGVAVASALVNVAVASLVNAYIPPMFGLTSVAWASVSGIVGSAAALVFSFVGFRVAVFKSSVQS